VRHILVNLTPFHTSNLSNIDILYMIRTGIDRGVFLSIFGVRPTNRPDATVRKPDSGGKKWSTIDVFWRFYE